MALLLFAVLAPAVCLLWFTGAAMRNERLAARQKLADAYRVQLSASQARLARYWTETVAELEGFVAAAPAPEAFAKCVQSGLVDSAVIFDAAGRVSYPNAPSAVRSDFGDLEAKWREAGRLEQAGNHLEAAERYRALARAATADNAAARAYQAQARCLFQAGRIDAVIQLVSEIFSDERYRHAADQHGRLIAANAELLALELMTNRNAPAFQSLSRRLAARLSDYENPALAAPQRRFLMKETRRLSPEGLEFTTLAAEELASERIGSHAVPTRDSVWQQGPLPNLWQLTTPNHRALALARSDRLLAAMKAVTALTPLPPDVKVELAPPDSDAGDAFVTQPAGEHLPGWRLALSLRDQDWLDAATGRQTAVYLWTAVLVVAGMGVLAVMAARLMRRQMRLARLKNDLAATVSHELRTPVSSVRVLVETLLDSEKLDEQVTREYLRLIARENQRLSRLVQNFLTFSRMERRKYAFQFSPLPPRQVVGQAIESVRERFDASGCRLEVQVEEDLPAVMADADALATALINLLENAFKYSDANRHIVVRARAVNGSVAFSVEDNGVGIAPRERGRVFQPFYQADQRLSRRGGGCGLGLSIVQFIATAHRGRVSVESRPGGGSTFTVSLPAARGTPDVRKEAGA